MSTRIVGLPFDEIWLLDFEFNGALGDPQHPVCLVAREYISKQTIRLWEDDLRALRRPPFRTDGRTVCVAFYSSAEWGCFRALDWRDPENVLDLFTEFRCLTNGLRVEANSLLGALEYYGLEAMDSEEKDAMRDLILRGGPWSNEERASILHYCERDVVALEALLPAMIDEVDLPRALHRGRYMRAAATVEWNGIPIDRDLLSEIRDGLPLIKPRLISATDSQFGVYEGGTFKRERFERLLRRMGVQWPRLPSGAPCLDADTFRDMAKALPVFNPLKELRTTLSSLKLEKLSVGKDGRNRCLVSAFRSITGRNQPSTNKFVFGPAVWIRALVRPDPGHALVYLDWSAQEIAIAAAVSRDPAMLEGYRSGDPYLHFAIRAGEAPASATKDTHPAVRDRFKIPLLSILYGITGWGLGGRLGEDVSSGERLIRMHQALFPGYWRWAEDTVDRAVLRGTIQTRYGWALHTVGQSRRTIVNFPIQANGSEMLRFAAILATEAGIEVCALVHDALLIRAPLEHLERSIAATTECMQEAGAFVLGGLRPRVSPTIIRYPDRYMDARGKDTWLRVRRLLDELRAERRAAHA